MEKLKEMVKTYRVTRAFKDFFGKFTHDIVLQDGNRKMGEVKGVPKSRLSIVRKKLEDKGFFKHPLSL